MNVVIIGAGNVGFEITKLLTKGNSILLIARNLPEYLKKHMKMNRNVFFAYGDATKIEDMETIANSEILRNFGHIDVLICTVGTANKSTSIEDFEGFKKCFNINYFANVIPIKIFSNLLFPSNNGRLIILSASSGHHAPRRLMGYSPAKWALENTYSSLREELKTNNITVDVIVVRTLKNKYSKVWTHDYGDNPEYVAKYIIRIIQKPTNRRHFLPKLYYFIRFTERLLPELFNYKYLKTLNIKRKIRFSQYKVKNVLITGASSGLGKELAKCYSKCSQNLFLIDRDYEGLEKTKEELLKTCKCQISINHVNLECNSEIIKYIGKLNQVDLIINNAATSYVGSINDVSINSYMQNFNINFFAPVFFTSELLRKKMELKKVINILSTTAIRGRKLYSPYSSAKGALWSWTRSLRRIYGRKIQVLEVIPSGMANTNYAVNMMKTNMSKRQTVSKKPMQEKLKILKVKNWTAERAAFKIWNAEKKGREIVMIPPIRAKLFILCETLSNWLFNKLFGK